MLKLLWKEWHEQSWKLAFGCLVLGALALIGLHSRVIADQTMMMWVCFLGLSLLPVLSSTGLIPAERSEGSFESLIAMPISPWRILLAKTSMGVLLCIGPVIVAALMSLLVAGNRELSSLAVVDLYGRSALATLSLFIWMLALTAGLPSEARAGLVAMGILILWLMASAALAFPPVPPWAFAFSPFAYVYGITTESDQTPGLIVVVLMQLLILTPLWFLTIRSFRTSKR